MVEFFEWCQSFAMSLHDTILSFIELVVSIGEAFLDLIKMLPSIVSMVTSSIGYLPSMLALFAGLSIAVSIGFLIAGRNNN